MHKKGPLRLNYSELHLLSVRGKQPKPVFLFEKNPQAFRSSGVLNCSVHVGNGNPHSLVTSSAVESKYISMLRGRLLNELKNLHFLEASVKALRGL